MRRFEEMTTPHKKISERHRPAEAMRNLIDWIVETERRLRAQQNHIDSIADRF